MDFKNLIKSDSIILNANFKTKEEVISILVKKLYETGALTDENEFFKAVMEREKISPTGLEDGLAIPHGKSDVVKTPQIAIARLENTIDDWESSDSDNKVNLIFLIAIPNAEKGNTHIEILSALTTSFITEGFIKKLQDAKNSDEIIEIISNPPKSQEEVPTDDNQKIILGITACATGIAHTYMAAEALEKAGREMGVRVIVEKQGANGIENRHTAELIHKAVGVIFATDIAAKDLDRFNGKQYIQVKVAEPLKNAKKLIEQTLNGPTKIFQAIKEENFSNEKGVASEIMQALMTGLSYMIPVIVAGGLMMGLAQLGGLYFGIQNSIGNPALAADKNYFISLLYYLNQYGGLIYKFMYPIFCAYVAFSIAGKSAIVSGLTGGAFAGGLHITFWNLQGKVPSGFFGAIILGLIAGYVSKFANNKIKLSKNLNAIKPMLIVPALSSIAILLANLYFVDPFLGGLNKYLMEVITASKESGAILLSTIIAACTAFDLGGPINKAAGAIAIGLAADKIFPLTARVLAIVIPPIGLGLATTIDKFIVKRRVFGEELKVVGETSILLGFLAISEGAIPFMIKNPFITIPLNIIGSILGAVTAVSLGAIQWLPLPAIWGWPLVENFSAYFIGLLVGVLFISISNVLVRYYLITKGKLKI